MRCNAKQTYHQFALKILFSLLLIFSFSIIGFGQTEESEESPAVQVPEQAMKQVVRRILVWYFKPRKQSKTIYLAAQDIQKSWLPKIKNIEFEFLSGKEIKENNSDVYFFTEPEKSGNKFDVGFAFGNPDCNNDGEIWHFRISKQKVRLWMSDKAFVSHCYD